MWNHCNSELCDNGLTVTFVQYTDGKLLPSAIQVCSSLGDRHLHLREINDLKLTYFFFKERDNEWKLHATHGLSFMAASGAGNRDALIV